MKFIGLARTCAIGFLLCVSLSGCFPSADSQLDEKKEPNFITGKNLVSQMDYPGAVDAFEKALEVDPHSASAHFELGWLYEEKLNDPAAAIYHYNRYLKFSSNPDNGDSIRSRIVNCKLELAKTVSAVGALPPASQREFDRVVAENKDFQGQISALQTQLAQEKTTAVIRNSQPVQQPQPPVYQPPPARVSPSHADNKVVSSPRGTLSSSSNSAGNRTHIIKPGETPSAIARIYGISVDALLTANPHVKPTHLLVGQTLNIPAR